jgi:phage major head subunit gpT-like protein
LDINAQNLRTAGVGFNAAYTRGLGQAQSQYGEIATTVPSSTKHQEYGWLGKMPSIRKWLGDRVINNISQSKYQITNEPYELTISVDRDDIEDDNLGIYAPLFEEMGRSVAAFPNELCFGMLKAGFTTTRCSMRTASRSRSRTCRPVPAHPGS